MLSWIKYETASLAFASLSLLITTIGSVVCIAVMVYVNVLMATMIDSTEKKWPADYEAGISSYYMFLNVLFAVVLSILAVSLAFTIILTKGLVSKKAHLVKTYFIYGVTKNIFSVLILFTLMFSLTFNIQLLFAFFGCLMYSLILGMIRKTYLKFETPDHDQFNHKKLKEDLSIA